MIYRILKYFFLTVSILILAGLIIFLSPPLWRHFVTYPKLEKQVNEFQKLRKETPNLTHLNVFRGVLHAHSFWSHDSEGTLFDLIPAAKNAGLEFIFLTDHPHGNIDTIPRGYHGNYQGILIESGSEKQGFDCWPLDSVIIDWKLNKDSIAKKIVSNGGIIFYAHTEEPHNWSNPDYQGMEIYNFHTDTKDESLAPHILNFLVNGSKYRSWALREMFDEQTTILARWDSLNVERKIVGFSAVDTHENQNFRARYLKDGRVEWVGPNANVIDTMEVKWWNKWLYSQPDPNGWIFKFMVDTYQEGFNYITNYVLADTLSIPSLAEHLKKGHLYTAFKSLGDAKGFMYYAQSSTDSLTAIMGDSVRINQVKTLNAVSPLPGQFRLIHDGKTVKISSTSDYQFSVGQPLKKGAYRIEIHVQLNGKYVPWLYSNPIYVF
ncbi:MAG: PHP domain-containing protein [Prolixibacteraceae bacterium]|nr:PHP domain-containing protein [Prolixibacteraceae bacterium]